MTPRAFYLIETMRWEDGMMLLDRHLARLSAAASTLGLPYDDALIRGCISEAAAKLTGGRAYRLRLTLHPSGAVRIATTTFEPWPAHPRRLALCVRPAAVEELYLPYKTSRREPYEAAYRKARRKGCDEVIFVNREGYVTEGSRTNLFTRVGGTYYTPAAASGLLPGVYRAHLLETLPDVRETRLTPDDLREADALYVGNALHHLSEAILAPAETFSASLR